MSRRVGFLLAVCVAAQLGRVAPAGELHRHLDPDPVRPECVAPSSADHTLDRAGHPERVSCLAEPSNTPHYTGRYVGGGCAHRGDDRGPNDGTWGWDYCGWFMSHHPWLGWCHGRRCQGGVGAYQTDGPHVPDPLGHFGL